MLSNMLLSETSTDGRLENQQRIKKSIKKVKTT